jgi:hypothetical protein
MKTAQITVPAKAITTIPTTNVVIAQEGESSRNKNMERV